MPAERGFCPHRIIFEVQQTGPAVMSTSPSEPRPAGELNRALCAVAIQGGAHIPDCRLPKIAGPECPVVLYQRGDLDRSELLPAMAELQQEQQD